MRAATPRVSGLKQVIHYQPRHRDGQRRLVPAAVHNCRNSSNWAPATLLMDSPGVRVQHGARSDPHRCSVRVIGG